MTQIRRLICTTLGIYDGSSHPFFDSVFTKKAEKPRVMYIPEVTHEPEVGPIFRSTKKVIESVLV